MWPTRGRRRKIMTLPPPAFWLLMVTVVACVSLLRQQQQGGMSPHFYLTFHSAEEMAQADISARRTTTGRGSSSSSSSSLVPEQIRGLRRSPLRRDEFFHTGPPEEVLREYFYFNATEAMRRLNGEHRNGERPIIPFWKCSPDSEGRRNRKKLVFLHMFRHAGSTIRALLRAYSHFCGAGMVTVSHCVDLGLEYMEGPDVWANGKHSKRYAASDCILGSAFNRSGHEVIAAAIEGNSPSSSSNITTAASATPRISTSFLQQHNIDVMAGHVPLGCDEYWDDEGTGHRVDTQYVLFLRDPLESFVSAALFAHRGMNLSVDDGYAIVNETVFNMTERGVYRETYSRMLITPQQSTWAVNERVQWTYGRRVNLTISNLLNRNVMVGVVERMPESLKMLQYLLDEDQEIPSLFQYFISASSTASNHDGVGLNTTTNNIMTYFLQTKKRTQSVVERVQRDARLMSMVSERLKYESQIYEWGRKVHEHQYDGMMLS